MPDSLYLKFKAKTDWNFFLILSIGWIICFILFKCRINYFGKENEALDGRFFGYSPQEVVDLFARLFIIEKLNFYAITELSLDLIFPIIYVGMSAFLIVRLYAEKRAKYLILIPVFLGLEDFAENFTIAYLAFTFNNRVSSIAYLASALTSLKWFLVGICLLIIIFGVISLLFKRKSQ